MRRFQQLLQGLDRTTGTSAKQQLLADYFRQAPAADVAWGLAEILLKKLLFGTGACGAIKPLQQLLKAPHQPLQNAEISSQ